MLHEPADDRAHAAVHRDRLVSEEAARDCDRNALRVLGPVEGGRHGEGRSRNRIGEAATIELAEAVLVSVDIERVHVLRRLLGGIERGMRRRAAIVHGLAALAERKCGEQPSGRDLLPTTAVRNKRDRARPDTTNVLRSLHAADAKRFHLEQQRDDGVELCVPEAQTGQRALDLIVILRQRAPVALGALQDDRWTTKPKSAALRSIRQQLTWESTHEMRIIVEVVLHGAQKGELRRRARDGRARAEVAGKRRSEINAVHAMREL